MRILTLLLLSAAIAACNNNAKTDTSSKVEDSKPGSPSSTSQNVRNDVKFNSSGLNVQQAFLMFEDGRLVPQDNKVEVGQQVNLRLIIDGWKANNGKVMLGASEKIATDEGQVILNEPDLFHEFAEGVNAADAGVITLSAVITKVDKLFKYFEVSFKVWDKSSNDNVTGSYRLYLK
jgi:hypothetical protein